MAESDAPGPIHDERRGKAPGAEELRNLTLGEHDGQLPFLLLDERSDDLGGLLGHEQPGDVGRRDLGHQVPDPRHLDNAGRAPGGPEVHEDDPVLEISERDRLPVERPKRPVQLEDGTGGNRRRPEHPRQRLVRRVAVLRVAFDPEDDQEPDRHQGRDGEGRPRAEPGEKAPVPGFHESSIPSARPPPAPKPGAYQRPGPSPVPPGRPRNRPERPTREAPERRSCRSADLQIGTEPSACTAGDAAGPPISRSAPSRARKNGGARGTTLPVRDLTRVRILWPDHLGLARGKLLLPGATATGHCLATFALGFDREMTAYRDSGLLDGLPDCRAVFSAEEVRPGWEDGVGVVVADLVRVGERAGEPLERSPRRVLKRAIAAHASDGRQPIVGIELEAFLLEPDGEGGFRPIRTPGSHVYSSGPFTDPEGVIETVLDRAERFGIPLESCHSEYDDGQFELTLGKKDALAAADEAFLFKQLARETAHEMGFHLTFLGKPFTDRGGSGLHVNLSLEADGGNQFDDPKGDHGLSPLAWSAVAGLLRHHRGLAGVVAPTVNAYRRLRPGQMSGYWANWARDHRGCAVRIPPERGEGSRIEHRLADGAAGPHIAVAATLLAARLGIERGERPPPEEKGDCLESAETAVTVASDLGQALDDLESDDELAAAFGEEFVRMHLAVKRAEWQRFLAHTTDWEKNEYLPYL